MIPPSFTTDLCLKCNICTAACPIAAVTDLFPGPKSAGPQAERFRHPRLPMPDVSVDWCSGCGTCSRVCPHGVAVAEINALAKGRLADERHVPIRDHIISRPGIIGRLASPVAALANTSISFRPTRWLLEKTVGISRHAPMPSFTRTPLRKLFPDRCFDTPLDMEHDIDHTVAFFHGCSNNYYEPELGGLTIAILERLGFEVVIPPQICCGLPLQSNGLLDAARHHAQANITWLAPFAKQGIPIVGTSTSCTLMLKHDYRTILGIQGEDVEIVASSTYDFFEFLTFFMKDEIKRIKFNSLQAHALYHPPCKLRNHGIGVPALQILRRIPDLQLHLSESECCGAGGTYGMKLEKFPVAHEVGQKLFNQIRQLELDFVICDSETCRWWIAKHTGLPVYHPLEIMARAMDIQYNLHPESKGERQ